MIKQVLLVDDSDDIHQMIKAIFAQDRVQIHSALDAKFGMVMAESLRPDLILLDVDMPEMDGYTLCEQLKGSLLLNGTPVIFLTGKAESNEKMKGLHLGAVDYVTKPFSPGELLERVRGALRRQSVISDMQERALIDAVTGLGNLKMFEARLRGEVSERARSLKPLTCAAMEMDNFRSLFQNGGEQFAQQALRAVAKCIGDSFRIEDVTCRVALNSFAILMPDTSIDSAIELAHAFKARLAKHKCMIEKKPITLTCSLSIAGANSKYDHAAFDRAAMALEVSPEGVCRMLVESPMGGPSVAA